jgi:hypothetical protein
MEPISVHFKLGEKEYLDACRLLMFTTEVKLRAAAGLFLFCLGLYFLLLAYGFELQTSVITGIVALTTLACLWLSARTTLPRRVYRGDSKFRDEITLTFSAEGVALRTTGIDSKVDWKLYTDVRESDVCYVLVYGRDIRTMTAIPKRAFKDAKQERAFRRLVFPQFGKELNARRKGEVIEDDYEPPSLQPPDWR